MATLLDIIQIAKKDGGKFFVMDEAGETNLVIMSVEEYQKMLLGKSQKQALDIEKVNQEITKAQLQEAASVPVRSAPRTNAGHVPENIPVEQNYVHPDYNGAQDSKEEVIDPSFDYEAPKVDIEEI